MINLENFAAVGEYVLVRKDQDTEDKNTIVIMSGDEDKVLKGEVISAETLMDEGWSDEDGESYEIPCDDLSNWRYGDKVLFNRMKSLPITQTVDEEVYIVRREDIFGGFTISNEEG